MGRIRTAHVDTFARDNLPPRSQWPEFRFDLPELDYPDRLNCAVLLLDEMVAAGFGNRVAIHTYDGRCSYAQLLAQANRIANVLVGEMDGAGNRVLRAAERPMRRRLLGVRGGRAMRRQDAICAPRSSPTSHKRRSRMVCDHRLAGNAHGAAACRCEDGALLLRRLRIRSIRCARASIEFEKSIRGPDVALIAFTSGTTGKTKGTRTSIAT